MKPQDFDRLSAYIDNQLTPAEKAALEQRLGREPELRAALTELRLTVKALRSLPTVKTPRNFTLTPAQVGVRPRRGAWFPTLRLAASLSAVALALVAGGDFAASRGYLGAAGPADAVILTTTENGARGLPPQETLTATPAAEADTSQLSLADVTETLTAEVAPGGGGDGSPLPEETPSIAGVRAPETPTPTSSADRMAEETPSADQAAEAAETATLDMVATAEAESTVSTKVVQPEATLFYATEAAATGSTAPGFPPLRVLEAALAMLTVLLGLGAWFASRNV